MLIEDYRLAFNNAGNARVSWTSDNADNVSWIYVDGGLARGPLYLGVTEREMSIPFKDGVTRAIEVHDFPDGTIVTPPIEIVPNTKPIIQWIASPTATRYKVYLTPFGESESVIYNRLAQEDKINYQLKLTKALTPGWNFIRVEAIDEFGNESVRFNWNYLVFDLPAPADNLAIVDGSGAGLFDISIT